MEDYFFELDCEQFSALAVESLLDEVYTTPKPGLVDRRNSGSHNDMDVSTFEKSAKCLKPYFKDCFRTGRVRKDLTHHKTFSFLRKLGIKAEHTMFDTTGGINTHKGAIYSFGIICASLGRLWTAEAPVKDVYEICSQSAEFVKEAVRKDFESLCASTAGERIYKKHGIKGIRGEVSSGFSSVLNIALPRFRKMINSNLSKNDAGMITLLYLIAEVNDTNVYHRGGIDGAEFAFEKTRALLKASPVPTQKEIESLDDAFIAKNFSPGGCADLLAITYFLYSLETLYK